MGLRIGAGSREREEDEEEEEGGKGCNEEELKWKKECGFVTKEQASMDEVKPKRCNLWCKDWIFVQTVKPPFPPEA